MVVSCVAYGCTNVLSRNPVEDGVDELAESDVSYIGDNLSISDLLADIIVRFCTSLHSKFQIRDWLKLTSVERRLVRLLADVTFSQS